MSLKVSELHKGDWIRCEEIKTQAVVEGQASHDLKSYGSSILGVTIGTLADITINVNFWNVTLIRKNNVHHQEAEKVD